MQRLAKLPCTHSMHQGRAERDNRAAQFTPYIEANARRVAEDPETYKKPQAPIEHPFGTMKRRSGFDHIITKRGIPAASADFGLTASAYNLKRLIKLGWKPNTCQKQFLDLLKNLIRPLQKPGMDIWPDFTDFAKYLLLATISAETRNYLHLIKIYRWF